MTAAVDDVYPPTFDTLDARVYEPSTVDAQTERYVRIKNAFVARFGKEPAFYSRSPGRVNIIGEHIDYCGFSVLPMAIARDVVIAVAEADDQSLPHKVTVVNIKPDVYKGHTFTHHPNTIVDIDSSIHEWSNYFKCGYKGAFEEVGLSTPSKALYFLVDGDVPAGAGVSSSAAFVCSSALATITALGKQVNKSNLAQTAIRAERYCGVQSGGMDQSISIMGKAESALLIHFVPQLSAEPIKFPANDPAPVFVIANTLVTADKHTTAPSNYNLRVVETRLAAAILAKHLGVSPTPNASSSSHITLRDVLDEWIRSQQPAQGKNEAQALSLLEEHVEQAFKDAKYTREEVASVLGMGSVAELESKFVGTIVIRDNGGFDIKKRARHVLSEARRVFQFRDVCALRAPYSGNLLKDLGDLMNASQTSCRDDFNCSCKELDELTQICRDSGAYGSRLTGAGWGGCTVSLVAQHEVPTFIDKVKKAYYYTRIADQTKIEENINDWIFASKPSPGAAVLKNLKF